MPDLRDFPISENRHWAIAPGIGYSYNDLKQTIDLSAVTEPFSFTVIIGSLSSSLHEKTAILKKALSSKTLITKYTSILKSLGYSFETNMPQDKIYDLINMQLDDMPSWDISNYSVDGTGSSEYTYSYRSQKLYVMIPDYTTVNKAKSLIESVESGL